MASSNKNCTICGVEYNYCPTCEQLGGWKYYADNPECYKIFMVLYEIREKIISELEAKSILENMGINLSSDFSLYIPSVAKEIRRILGENKEQTLENSKLEILLDKNSEKKFRKDK